MIKRYLIFRMSLLKENNYLSLTKLESLVVEN